MVKMDNITIYHYKPFKKTDRKRNLMLNKEFVKVKNNKTSVSANNSTTIL